MKKTFLREVLWLAAVSTLGLNQAYARKSENPDKNGKMKLVSCTNPTSRAVLEINNVRTTLLNAGDLWWDLDEAKYEVPKNSGKNALFSGAVWIGGTDQVNGGNILLSSQTYRGSQVGYWAGPIVQNSNTISQQECDQWNRHFTIYRDSVIAFRNSYQNGQITNINQVPKSILGWPGKGNPNIGTAIPDMSGANMNFVLADFVDKNTDGIYNPMDGDYPVVKGDQNIWWVMNDVGNTKVPSSNPMGLEMQVSAYACADCFTDNTTFYDYKLINKGSATVYNTHFGQWVETDLGYYYDDYIQCDVGRGMGFCYNADDYDEGEKGYGAYIPAIGIDFVKGFAADANDNVDNNRNGVTDEANEEIIMSDFRDYWNDSHYRYGNPFYSSDFYYYMSSRWKDSTSVTYDGNFGGGVNPVSGYSNLPCKFMYPGNSDQYGWGVGGTPASPNVQLPWSKETAGSSPTDVRFVMSAGPFTFSSGEVQTTTIATVWSYSSQKGAQASVANLLRDDDMVQDLVKGGIVQLFRGPQAPNTVAVGDSVKVKISFSPATYLTEFNGQVRSTTTENHEEYFDSQLFQFQGYQVFQVIDSNVRASSLNDTILAKQVAQCDKADAIASIANANGYGVTAANAGLRYSFTFTKDAFTNSDLIANTSYYYIVVPYSVTANTTYSNRFMRGCNIAKVKVVTPRNTFNSPTATDYFSNGVVVKQLSGVGNSGIFLKLKPEMDSVILADVTADPVFQKRYGPVNVSITDRNIAAAKNFRLELTSRLSFYNQTSDTYLGGDTIYATALPSITSTLQQKVPGLIQTPGKAIINRVVSNTGGVTTLDISLLNESEGGTFTFYYDSLYQQGSGSYFFLSHNSVNLSITKTNATGPVQVKDYTPYDYWKLTDTDNGDIIYSTTPVSVINEQVVSAKGIAIQVQPKHNLLHYLNTPVEKKLVGAEVTYAQSAQIWMKESINVAYFQRSGLNKMYKNNYLDKNKELTNVLGGTWAPYSHVQSASTKGPAIYSTSTNDSIIYNSLNKTGNIDVVFTSDQSKWTEVVVLQFDPIGSTHPGRYLNKSMMPSINKNGQATGANSAYRSDSLSRGKSWFPGYAIDLDRGMRLNMVFSESNYNQPGKGNDLKWSPADADTSRSFIYILNTPYDGGQKLERTLDSIRYLNLSATTNGRVLQDEFYKFTTWVGNVHLKSGQTALQTDARVSLRVRKAYQTNNNADPSVAKNPVYQINIPSNLAKAPVKNTLFAGISLYPNPAQDEISVKLSDNEKISRIKITDIGGRMVYNNASETTRINTSAYPNGLYLIRIETTAGKDYTGKFVVNK